MLYKGQDEITRGAFESINGLPPLDHDRAVWAQLTLRQGGMGLRSFAAAQEAAHVGAWCHVGTRTQAEGALPKPPRTAHATVVAAATTLQTQWGIDVAEVAGGTWPLHLQAATLRALPTAQVR